MYKEPRVTVLPVTEPVSLEEAAAQVKQDSSDDDTTLQALITVARELTEARTGRALISRTLQFSLDSWPRCRRIVLPYAPLSEVLSVIYYDEDGVEYTLSTDDYEVDAEREPGAIVLKRNISWPTLTLRAVNGVVIEYVAGYGEADQVPQVFKQMMLLLIASWYQYRNQDEIVLRQLENKAPTAFNALAATQAVMYA